MKEQVKKEMVKIATFDATKDQNDYLVFAATRSGGSKASVLRGLIQSEIDATMALVNMARADMKAGRVMSSKSFKDKLTKRKQELK